MIRHYSSFYCRRCGHIRRFTKRGLDYRKHLCATLVTFGLWGIVWLFLHRREQRRTWRCTICRSRQRSAGIPVEEAPLSEEPTKAIPIAPRR